MLAKLCELDAKEPEYMIYISTFHTYNVASAISHIHSL